jgi:hypothetical protein
VKFDLCPRGLLVALVLGTSVMLAGCGDDSSSGDPSATDPTSAPADACVALAEDPRFNGEARFAGAFEANGGVECGLEFRADTSALTALGVIVSPLCPPEASIIVKFTQVESGELIFDEIQTAETENGSCL